MNTNPSRRQMLSWAAAAAGSLLLPTSLWAASKTPGMTEGPFYPRAKDLPLDQDNDLTIIAGKSGVAAGVLLDFGGRVVDENGKPQRNALVEIWQCNAHGRYHDSRDDSRAPLDPFFQGFGKTVTDADGRYRFRTIKPVAYPGRTPHIHFKVKSRDFGELTSQVLIDGEAGNGSDFVMRSIRNEADRRRVLMTLKPAPPDSTAKLVTDFEIVVG